MPQGGRSEERTGSRIGRRDFLRGVGATGAGVALAGTLSGTASAGTEASPQVAGIRPAWRLSPNGSRACNACKGQGANKYFRKKRFAKVMRAHDGCNCPILRQRLGKARWQSLFISPDGTRRDVWDVRWEA